jgi:hypothetical protein
MDTETIKHWEIRVFNWNEINYINLFQKISDKDLN